MTEHTPGPWRLDFDDRPGMEWNIHVVLVDNDFVNATGREIEHVRVDTRRFANLKVEVFLEPNLPPCERGKP